MATARVRIVSVGDELLEGRTSDTNATRIQRALGRHAVRIEDIVVCTADGGESLNESPRELRVVAGR